MVEEIRKYTVPLRESYKRTRVHRAQRAIKDVRAFVSKHMKTSEDNVILEESINHTVWSRSGKKVVPKITIETERTKEGKVRAWVAGKRKVVEKPKEEKKPAKKEEKPDEKEAEKKEETKGEKEEKAAKEAPKKAGQKAVKEKTTPTKQPRQALQSKGR
ncbi:MAG: 60S ribosomal protein L31 [Candidatus Diapherotrites archaeon]|nr:60S ribosomal protein L31 [Candidatus Diapherotrites archaeon]